MSPATADFFCKEAHRLSYVARSAFKLLEIQRKHRLIRPGASVLDLGCAPGAWLQVACGCLGSRRSGGCVIGVDLKKVKLPLEHCDERVRTLRADVVEICPRLLAHEAQSQGGGYSVILSDMCPPVSGIAFRDAAVSGELGMRALELALGSSFASARGSMRAQCVDEENHEGLLKPGGSLVIKLLEGDESQCFPRFCKSHFKTLAWYRPKATRSASREIYLVAKTRLPPSPAPSSGSVNL